MYIIIVNSLNKVVPFCEDRLNSLNDFLNSEKMTITKDNYFSEEEWKRFKLYRHVPNFQKTESQFFEYCQMAKRIGLPAPERNSKIRPLHEYGDNAYRDENGMWALKKTNKKEEWKKPKAF